MFFLSFVRIIPCLNSSVLSIALFSEININNCTMILFTFSRNWSKIYTSNRRLCGLRYILINRNTSFILNILSI